MYYDYIKSKQLKEIGVNLRKQARNTSIGRLDHAKKVAKGGKANHGWENTRPVNCCVPLK